MQICNFLFVKKQSSLYKIIPTIFAIDENILQVWQSLGIIFSITKIKVILLPESPIELWRARVCADYVKEVIFKQFKEIIQTWTWNRFFLLYIFLLLFSVLVCQFLKSIGTTSGNWHKTKNPSALNIGVRQITDYVYVKDELLWCRVLLIRN